MKRIAVIGLLLALFLPASASANPFSKAGHWVAHHKRFVLMEAAAVGAAGVHAYGLHHCRRLNGVEPCDEHYGAAWGQFGIVTGFNMIVMPSLAEAYWKASDDSKVGYVFAYGGSAFQMAWGIHEARISAEHQREWGGKH